MVALSQDGSSENPGGRLSHLSLSVDEMEYSKIKLLECIPTALQPPLEDQAFTFYAQRFMQIPNEAPKNLPSFVRDVYLKHSSLEPILHTVLGANALLVFGRSFTNESAKSKASEKYIQALKDTRTAMIDSKRAATDQFLLAVMLLAVFEVGMITFLSLSQLQRSL